MVLFLLLHVDLMRFAGLKNLKLILVLKHMCDYSTCQDTKNDDGVGCENIRAASFTVGKYRYT